MERQSPNSVLRRKAHAAKEVWQARAMSPAKALRLSVARAAEDLWDLAAAASGLALTEETLDTAIEALPEEGLILLLDGPEGLVGAAYLPFAIVAGLIEAQTVGRVGKAPPEVRAVTRTDAAMVAPLIDGMLERFDALLEDGGTAPWARGYRFGTMMDSARMLSLALKATDFHVMRFSLDLAALREGEAILMMPVAEQVAQISGSGAAAGSGGHGALEAQILQAPTELRAVLHRVSMPLSAVSALRVGEILEIPREALSKTEVEVGPQTVIGTTTLGQMNGMRALRLVLPGQELATAPPQEDPALPAAPDAAPAPMPVAPLPVASDPEPEPDGDGQIDDLLGDLPDIGDLPGLAADDGDGLEGGDLPDLGIMPMAALPDLD